MGAVQLKRAGNLNRICDIYMRNDNAFDFLRFLLASLVIYSHSYPLLFGANGQGDYLTRWTNNQLSFGQLAVFGFFIISGFLITQSLQNSSSLRSYFLKRLLRIVPAFFVSLFIIAFILGPLLTRLNFYSYFFANITVSSPFAFLLKNLTFNIFGYSWTVQDLFNINPFPGSANGSMWTLKHEFAMYLIVPLLSFFLFFRLRLMMLISTIFLCTLVVFNIRIIPTSGNFWVLSIGEYSTFIIHAFYFLAGSLLYLYRNEVYFSKRILLLCFLIILVGNYLGELNKVLLVCLPYIIIGTGISWRFSTFSRYGDFSYGLYIYAFPIQQTLIYLFKNKLSILTFFSLSFLCTLVLAILSWRYIEKPALNLKKLIGKPNINVDKETVVTEG